MTEEKLTQAEKRCLIRSFEICKTMPDYPELYASFNVSRHATLESLRDKGFLIWCAYRGSTYRFTEKARQFVGAPSVTSQNCNPIGE